MSTNDPEYQRLYKQKHYAVNKQRYIEQAAARKEVLKQEVWAIKSSPCMDCHGSFPPWVMQFDHRDPEQKVANIGRLIANYNRKKLFDEIAKCDVVCANCHADRTYKRL